MNLRYFLMVYFNLFFEYCQLVVFFNQYCRYLLFNCKLEFINFYLYKYNYVDVSMRLVKRLLKFWFGMVLFKSLELVILISFLNNYFISYFKENICSYRVN